MNSLERCKESWELSDQERISESLKCKEKGTLMLKDGKHAKAIKLYNRAVELVNYLEAKETGSDEDKELIKKAECIKLAGHLNLALCQNKAKNYADAVHNCDKALAIDATNEKALFRKGEAQFAEHNYKEAKSSFEMAYRVNSKNKLAYNYLVKCKTQIKNQIEQERNTFRGMFDKFVQQDEREEVLKKIKLQEEKAKMKAEKKAAAATNEESGGGGEG